MPGAPRPDRLGALLCGGGVIACLWLPFVLYKGNRILPGVPHGMYEALPPAVMPALLAALVLAAAGALFARDARWRLAGALLGLAALAFAVGAAGTALTPAGNKVVRVAPASGFWLLLLCLALLATDAVTRLRPRRGLPLRRRPSAPRLRSSPDRARPHSPRRRTGGPPRGRTDAAVRACRERSPASR